MMIRIATELDLNVLMCIEQAAHSHPWTPSILLPYINKKCVHVGLVNEQIVGFAVLRVVADEAELLNIAIAPEQQGQGYGAMLLIAVLHVAQGKASQCYLEVRESNQAAIALYERYDFVQVGMRPRYYPTDSGYEDALLYARELCD
ncbi:MAG: ribosomal protein S18-alanine N-acetyltransferase [Bacterioplanes sp.]|nr:ribosomal protein S18-alanine N-acetyltransferase [Bacterioplanes sp.]